jgi:hypothetical protein
LGISRRIRAEQHVDRKCPGAFEAGAFSKEIVAGKEESNGEVTPAS